MKTHILTIGTVLSLVIPGAALATSESASFTLEPGMASAVKRDQLESSNFTVQAPVLTWTNSNLQGSTTVVTPPSVSASSAAASSTAGAQASSAPHIDLPVGGGRGHSSSGLTSRSSSSATPLPQNSSSSSMRSSSSSSNAGMDQPIEAPPQIVIPLKPAAPSEPQWPSITLPSFPDSGKPTAPKPAKPAPGAGSSASAPSKQQLHPAQNAPSVTVPLPGVLAILTIAIGAAMVTAIPGAIAWTIILAQEALQLTGNHLLWFLFAWRRRKDEDKKKKRRIARSRR